MDHDTMAKSPKSSGTTGASKTRGGTAAKRSTTKAVSKTPKAAKATKKLSPRRAKSVKTAAEAAAAPQVEAPRPKVSKKELIARVAELADMKPGEARRAVEATLEGLRDVLDSGNDIAAAPLGKMMITREKDTKNGKLVVCRIKLKPKAARTPKDPLAQAAE